MKITIDDIKAQFASTNSINLRFKQVADEFNEKVLYRSPGTEPNAMDADIDMADNDIFNVLTLHTKELFVDGQSLGGDHLWGSISGNLADQADLKTVLDNLANGVTSNDGDILSLQTDVSENVTDIQNNTDAIIALNNSNNSKLNGIAVSTDRDTSQSLEIDNSVGTLPKIRLTAQVGTKSPNTLVKLNASGLIPSEQLPFGGAYTPIGVFTVAADPGPYDNPSTRNPGTDYTNGEFFSIALPGAQTEGTVVAVDPNTGLEVDTIVNSGDALLYSEGNTSVTDGWYVVSRGGAGAILATDVQYDATGNRVIAGTSINVDLALTDLDALLVKKDGDVMTGPLTIKADVSTQMILRGHSVNDTVPQLNIQDETGDRRCLLYSTLNNGNVILERRGPGNVSETVFTLTNNGNVTVSGAEPVSVNHLTRKDYVDGVMATIYESMFPVGAVHIHPNPNGVIPGTWVQLAEGTFLMNTVAGAAPTGGANSVALADGNLPSHTHPATFAGSALPTHAHNVGLSQVTADPAGSYLIGRSSTVGVVPTAAISAGTPAGSVSVTGNGGHVATPVENRPLFKGVAVWERTA